MAEEMIENTGQILAHVIKELKKKNVPFLEDDGFDLGGEAYFLLDFWAYLFISGGSSSGQDGLEFLVQDSEGKILWEETY